MANTVSTISYANTFGQWMVATNALVAENNRLAASDYIKDSGTLYLSETTKNALQANGNIIVQKQLLVQGVASSATVDNNLTVAGQVYFSNAVLGLTNTGQANINGLLVAQGPGIGLNVANNAYVGGNTTIKFNTITNNVQANSTVNTTTASITGTTYTNNLEANSKITGVVASISSSIYTNALQANSSIVTDSVQANNTVNTASASITGTTFTKVLQANTSTNTATASVTGTTFTNVLQANTSVNTATSSVTGTTLTNVLQANTSTNTATASVTGTTFTNLLQANTSTNTATASVTGTTFTNLLQANTSVNTATIFATTSLVANTITANISASIPTLTVGTKFDGNNAAGFINSLQVQGGGLTVNGNFILTGTTVYASNTFQISTGTSSGITSYLQVARGSSGANAAFRWNEPLLYWETLDVTDNVYSRVITENYLANQTGSFANSAFGKANSAASFANGAFGQANSAASFANGAFIAANTAANTGTSAASFANGAFLRANASYALANTFANTFVGTTGSISQSSGVISFSSNNGITVVATSANNLAISSPQDLRTSASPTFAGLSLTAPLELSQGGTGKTSAASALTALLPTGTISGYVLTTGGAGNFYWSASAGGGGGATPGTSINSTRLSYTANGAAGYTGNSFTIPVATSSTQVRAYINGVRQFESEYGLNLGANTITFTTVPPSGDAVLIEVDGYYVNPYYANNIAYTINSNISTTANTIQLAIDALTSKVTTYYANTNINAGPQAFGNVVTGITMPAGTSNASFATTEFSANAYTITVGTLPSARLPVTGVSSGTYGGSTAIPVVTIDSTGRVTSAANVSVTQTAVYANTGQLTANAATGVVAVGLATSGVIAGNYGSGTTTPIITIDAYGRITGATTTLITGGSAGIGATSYVRTSFTATAGQTSFTVSYTVGYVQVYVNGVLLSASDYTSSSGTSIVMGSALRVGDLVDIFAYTVTLVNNVSPSYTGGQGGAAGQILYQSAANTTSNTDVGTTGQLLLSGGTGKPTWSSNVQVTSIGVGTAASGTTGEIRATNNITAYYSDDRLKTKLGTINNALDKLCSLTGFYYEANETAQALGYGVRREVGVSAQDVQKVLPEIVTAAPIDDKYLTIYYDKLIPLVIEAIKELKQEVDALKGNIK